MRARQETLRTREQFTPLARNADRDFQKVLGEDYLEKALDAAKIIFHAEEPPVLHFPPIEHNHDSQAQYIVDRHIFVGGRGEMNIGYIYVLAPNAKTSKHWHPTPHVLEDYYQLIGETAIDGVTLKANDHHVVRAGEIHQAQAGNNWSLTVVVTRDAGRIPRDKLHIT